MTHNRFLLCIFCFLFSCKASQNNSSDLSLITIEGTSVPVDEFVYVYTKNNFNNDSTFSKEDVKDYLDLYINFKLKVKEAEEKGLHEKESFKEELEGYRKQLAKPYLTESGVTDELVKEAYERLKTEINASHILIGLAPEAAPEDTLRVFNKLMQIRAKALGGEDFAALAKEHSEDPSAASNGGNLGYFTALQMVYPFEDAAYKTKEGEISYPVRTRFGYHLIYVKDKRPSQGKVKVSHIMVRATQGISPEDSVAARKEIYEIYEQLQNGADWFEMASQYSDDISTKSSGGALPWFGTGNMIPEFEAVAFSLDEPGEFSAPLKTVYGWHIIKLDEKQELESFEVLEPSLKMKVTKDSRAELNKIALINRLKQENNYQKFDEVIAAATSEIDSTLVLGKWSYSSENQQLGSVLFSINDREYTVKDFYDFVSENQRQQNNVDAEQYMKMLFDQFVDTSLIAYEEEHLADKYEDYRMLFKEYRDGILLFELMDKKVWSKAVEDSAGLRNFYEQHKENYYWKERAEATIFSSASKAVIDSIKAITAKPNYQIGKSIAIQADKGDVAIKGENKKLLDSLAAILLEDTLLSIHIALPSGANPADNNIVSHLKDQSVDKDRIIVSNEPADKKDEVQLKLVTTSAKRLEKQFNKENALTLQVEEGKYEKAGLSAYSIEWKPGQHEESKAGRFSLVIIEEILPAERKDFEDIRGQVISDYQNFLEKQWVADLRAKYNVTVDEDALEKVFEQLENI